MRTLTLIMSFCAISTPGLAQENTHNPTLTGGCFGAGEPLFHCTLSGGRKSVDLCLQGDTVIYRFGAADGPTELLLARDVTGVGLAPWNGVGRTIWEEVTVYNSVYSYLLSYSIDRQAGENVPTEGRLIVAEGDSEVADFACDPGSVGAADFDPIFEMKEVAGQCYVSEKFSWEPC